MNTWGRVVLSLVLAAVGGVCLWSGDGAALPMGIALGVAAVVLAVMAVRG